MKDKVRRVLSFLLVLAILMGVVPLNPIKVFAAGPGGGGSKIGDQSVDINEENFPDPNLRKFLQEKFDTNEDWNLNYRELEKIGELDFNSTPETPDSDKIYYLTGISKLPNLYSLKCAYNGIKYMNPNEIKNLEYIDCSYNQIKEIDFTNKYGIIESNSRLKYLDCSGNKLTSLNLTNAPALEELYCYNSQLESIKGTSEALQILSCGDNKIKSIEPKKFPSLRYFVCSNNQIGLIDLSKNLSLKNLDCSNNQISSIDLGGIFSLNKLNCSNNQISSINLSKNLSLENLDCSYNHISVLDLSHNKNLRTVHCIYNNLKELKFANSIFGNPGFDYPKLEMIDCSNNQLEELTITFVDKVRELLCNNNKLKELNLIEFNSYEKIDCSNNQLETTNVASSGHEAVIDKINLNNNHLTSIDEELATVLLRAFRQGKNGELEGDDQTYTIEVPEDTLTFNTNKFPGKFNSEFAKIEIKEGATLLGSKLTVNSKDTNEVKYKYGHFGAYLNVTLNVKVKKFDPEHVEKMVVKEQPTKLNYTEGEKLDLTGLVVTLTDNQSLTKDVAFKDFATYGITAEPTNDTALTLANNAKKVTLTKGKLTAETEALTVKAKEFDPEHVEKMVVKEQPTKLNYT
ncbi:leucine-rich repeat domain-containing protein, partial [Peptoniphilus lacrimalis]